MSPASLAKRSFRTVEPVSRLRLSAAQTRHYPRCVCNVIFRSHRHELTNTTHDMNQKRSLFYSVVFMSKTIVFRKRYHELKMGHFGEIRLADPVFSAVVLPSFMCVCCCGVVVVVVWVESVLLENSVTNEFESGNHINTGCFRRWKTSALEESTSGKCTTTC